MTATPRAILPKPSRTRRLPAWLAICGLVFLLTFALWRAGYFQFLELQIYDYFLRHQPRSAQAPAEVVVIGITEDDIRQLNTYPVPVAALADALEAINRQEPAAVVVDLYRDLPIPGTNPTDQERLVRCFTEHPNVLAIRRLGLGGAPDVPAPPFLKDHSEQAGFNDFSLDYRVDDTARRVLLSMDDGARLNFSVSLLATMLYLQPRGIELEQDTDRPERFRLGRATLIPFEPNDGPYIGADARGFQMLLDFRGPRDFPIRTFTAARTGGLSDGELRGKVVLIGLMANSVKDHIGTPLSRRFPGVLLHAHVVHQLIRQALYDDRPVRFLSEPQETLWLLAWCAAGTLIGVNVRASWLFVGLVLGGLAALAAGYWFALGAGWWLLVVAPAAAFTAAAAVGTSQQVMLEKRQRDVLMRLFSQHVSPHIAAEVWRQREQFMEGQRPKPQLITATVFFSDLKAFTRTAETLPPETLLVWLNEYMEMMAALIEEHDGLVIKYMGDAVMAAFGAPLPRETAAAQREDACHAVRCALRMSRQLDELNRSWEARGLPRTTMRIGIATGPVVSGSIGGARRLEYTVTGDTVVVAKRLESVRKELPPEEMAGLSSRILISETTARQLEDRFELRELGATSLEGKHEAVATFAVLREKTAPDATP